MDRSKLRSAYIPHERVRTIIEGESLTRQEFADECDVNALMARYDKVGVWPPPPPGSPMYMDFTEMPENLQDAMNLMMDADAAFMRLPATVRREFDNDAVKFVEFASDAENIDKLREWGLAEPLPAPDKPMRVEVVNSPVDEPAKP